MFKKIMPYNLRKVSLLALLTAMIAFTSCEKDDNDPTKDKIDQLKAQLKRESAEVRLAVGPAKTQPYDITSSFNGAFTQIATGLNINPVNIVDSSKVFVAEADSLVKWYNSYANPTNMNILKGKAGNVVSTASQLEALLANQR